YMGFFLPFMATHKRGYIFGLPMSEGLSDEAKAAELKILDTSVVIDGRIADIADTGFVSGTLIVPKFVLNEIQALADSQDPIKRSRARRAAGPHLAEGRHRVLEHEPADPPRALEPRDARAARPGRP
ncbi:MAG TPA: PIN/TRAM domain-containing protein, partial [bacterium]|nr:PIN/TRAM domain-containing protein [bacterium]